MRISIGFFILAALAAGLFAEPPLGGNTTLVNGFAEKVSGQDFTYHSSIPMARESLLIRATDGNSVMEWTTAPAPDRLPTEYVSFVWLAGIGSSPGRAGFDLAVDGVHAFTFWTDGGEEWELVSEDGASLRFRQNRVDQHGDRFGFMFLTIPAERVKAGAPLSIKATGGNFGKSSWYMTFMFPLESGLNFRALPALVESPGQTHQVGIAGILHFGGPDTARISIGGNPVKEIAVNFGYTHAGVQWPAVDEKTRLPYRMDLAGQTWEGNLEIRPVRHWRVNFVQHTHTDIGYTRPQTEILSEHLRFIDYALDYCDLTDDLPDEAKFRWTCEASWAVDEYLRSRPSSQVERLLKRVGEGRIEITGMFFNFDELPDEQTLAASLRPLSRFRDLGLDVKTAMQNDVNGIAWCLNDTFHDLGVKYLNMGTHGHRALICFDKPTLFWWESPSGKRMLAYRAEHYMTGNTVFKIHAGDFRVFEEELLAYLAGLENKGYEYDLISIQHSGYLTDNAPPSTFASDMIRRWNDTYSWPKLKTASATEFFEEMEARHGDSFPVIRGAWPDWWTDGFGASAREVAATRTAQSDLIAHTAGLTMAALQGAAMPEKLADRIEAANEALLFYTEHTVGYHGSVRQPFHKNTMEQRAIKESYAWEASRRAKMLGEEALGLLQSYHAREEAPSLVVYNTLNWRRSGLVKIYIDHQLLPRDVPFEIVDQTGKPVMAQPLERHSDGTYWAVRADDIPAFGFKKYVIKSGADAPAQGPPRRAPDGHILDNRWYRIVVDPDRGAISGITDKDLNLDIVDAKAAWKFGEFIYERLDNRAQMEAFKLDNYTREPLNRVRFDAWEPGDVWDTVRFKGDTRAAERDGAFVFEIRLFHAEKRIDLFYAIGKKMVVDPEGIYLAFPFFLENGVLAFDVPGGEIRAGIDQIPGSANDWNTVQNYARLYNDDAQILIGSREIPMMQFGAINTGRYQAGAVPETTHIYGWPMNNYWVTNFNPEQHGGIEWTYSVSSRAGREGAEGVRFGWGNRTPFLCRVLPGGGSGDEVWEGSFITGWPDDILLVSAVPDPDGRSAMFHVRETGGKKGSVRLQNGLTGSPLVCIQVDAVGRPVENGGPELHPYESKFFRVAF
jgi:alpha-mannosidase